MGSIFDLIEQADLSYKRFSLSPNPENPLQAIEDYQKVIDHPGFEELGPLINAEILRKAGLLRITYFEENENAEEQYIKGKELLERSLNYTEFRFGLRAGILSILANSYFLHYEKSGNLDDLEKGILTIEKAIEIENVDTMAHSSVIAAYALGLMRRYERLGHIEDLDRAIQLLEVDLNQLERILKSAPPPRSFSQEDILDRLSWHRYKHYNNLGTLLRLRYSYDNNLSYLNRAVDAHRRSVDLTESSEELPIKQINLGNILLFQYQATQEPKDLEDAVAALESGVSGTKKTNVDYAARLSDLGNALIFYYQAAQQKPGQLQRQADQEFLKKAIDICKKARKRLGNEENKLGLTDLALSQGYYELAIASNDSNIFYKALDHAQKAVKETPLEYARYARALFHLAYQQQYLSDLTKDTSFSTQAIRNYRKACRSGLTSELQVTLNSAHQWGLWAMQRGEWEQAQEAWDYGRQAADQMYKVQLLRASKEIQLRDLQPIAALAAYTSTKLSEYDRAVEQLENGRARMLTEATERERADLERIKNSHPDLVQQYREAADRIRLLSIRELQQPDGSPVLPGSMKWEDNPKHWLERELRDSTDQLETVIGKIRSIPGYHNFMASVSIDTVRQDLEIPLLYLSATPMGGMALLVTQKEVRCIPLDSLTTGQLENLAGGGESVEDGKGYIGAYLQWQQNHRQTNLRDQWFDQIDRMLDWSWNTIFCQVFPILRAERIDKITLVPQGLLGLLPLHAARWKESGDQDHQHYLIDTIQVRYAPSAQVLREAQKRSKLDANSVLVVDNPDGSLSFAHEEILAVLSGFPAENQINFEGAAATYEAVKASLTAASVLHFSTHGAANPMEPLEGELLLHDRSLKLRDILQSNIQEARLAILSACETGVLGWNLPDEVISLSSGFLQAGVPGVISSQWLIDDISTMLVMAQFYRLWRKDHKEPADAIRLAQIWLRDSSVEEKLDLLKTFLDGPSLEASDRFCRIFNRRMAQPFYWIGFSYTGV